MRAAGLSREDDLAFAQKFSLQTSAGADRRRHQRVGVALLGRYMLTNRQEYPCRTIDISPGGVSLIAPVKGAVGERVVVYLEHIGRIEGQIARVVEDGFAMSILATPRKREKIASQLTWLANRDTLGMPEDRRHERVTPMQARTTLTVEDGREYVVRIIDLSRSGVAVSTDLRLSHGDQVTVGRTIGRVVRVFDGGVAIEFMVPIAPDAFHDGIVL